MKKIKNKISPIALLTIIGSSAMTYANENIPNTQSVNSQPGQIPVHLVNNSGTTLHVCLFKDPVDPNTSQPIQLGDSGLVTKELETNGSSKNFDFNLIQSDVYDGGRLLISEQDCTTGYPDLAKASYLYDIVEVGGERRCCLEYFFR